LVANQTRASWKLTLRAVADVDDVAVFDDVVIEHQLAGSLYGVGRRTIEIAAPDQQKVSQ
jgi:hypothetical protein